MDRRWALRRVALLFAVLVVAGATTGIFATPASSGPALQTQTVTITKVVTGSAPAGATFTVHVSCVTLPTGGFVGDVTFNAAGGSAPGSPNAVTVSGVCTFTEPGKGGATSSSGSCTINSGANATCGGGGSAPVLVDFAAEAFTATVTFTNTFAAAATTTTTAAPAVVAGPRFTG